MSDLRKKIFLTFLCFNQSFFFASLDLFPHLKASNTGTGFVLVHTLLALIEKANPQTFVTLDLSTEAHFGNYFLRTIQKSIRHFILLE